MSRNVFKATIFIEITLSLVCLGLTALIFVMQGHKMVILNLFFLPVSLAGFALGRYRAGMLALFCALCASVAAAFHLSEFTWAISAPVAVLSLAVWAAVLGLVAILIGTLSDDGRSKMAELHDAYVGVVGVLAQYLQSANPRLKSRSLRAAELSRQVATRLRFSPSEVDDICVASLLYDIGSIEVTTRVMFRAIDALEGGMPSPQSNTFQGLDLMLSLGSVLHGAVPLLLSQDQNITASTTGQAPVEVPLGAEVIRTARAYCDLIGNGLDQQSLSPAEAIESLRRYTAMPHNLRVLDALEHIVAARDKSDLQDDPSAFPVIPSGGSTTGASTYASTDA
jgi:hypothetical protein